MLNIISDRVKIIIAGSITYENLPEVHNLISGVEYHLGQLLTFRNTVKINLN